MSSLVLDKVKKVYPNGYQAIREISFETEENDFLILIGPSGCGKTTVLRMIAGLEDITSGDMYLNGKRLNDLSPKERNIGMVFQNYALYPHLSVYENIAFPLKIAKTPKGEIEKAVHEAAELVDLSKFLKSKPKELSGGQRQRTALARAIIRKPNIFLFDEPLSNLDANLRLQMRTELKKIHERSGISSVYVTHDQVEAMTMGSSIAVLKDGELHQFDTPENIYRKPADIFTASFIGNPVINIFKITVENNTINLDICGKSINFEADFFGSEIDSSNQELKIGIRPELFSFSKQTENDVWFDIKIHQKEYLGYEVIYYFKQANKLYAIRSDKEMNFEVGSKQTLFFSPPMAIFFNKSGKLIN